MTTLDPVTLEPIVTEPAKCADGTPFPTYGTHYQCQLDTDEIPVGPIIISIHLDDGIDPSTGISLADQPFGLDGVSDDREIQINIK